MLPEHQAELNDLLAAEYQAIEKDVREREPALLKENGAIEIIAWLAMFHARRKFEKLHPELDVNRTCIP